STKANSSKGDYTWTRKVVSNGEEVTLTEVGSGLSKLKSMNANTWYVVKYNAKGEVKNVYPAWDTVNYKGLISADAKNELNDVKRLEDQYVNDIEELNTATNENSLALYEVGPYNTSVDLRVGNTHILTTKPSVDNHTFYVKTETNTGVHQGFRVADDVKTVFIQTNNREESTIFESGYSRLEKIVDRLHDHAEIGTWAGTSGYHYELSAVMENGRAVVVVIRDLNGAGANFTYDRNRELRLYGNLFTAPNTVTGASNAVVTVGNQEVKPSGIGTDRFGSYTTYSIPQGSIVGIVDYDIDNVTPRFDYMTNMVYSDLNVRYLNRTITFTMPDYNAWIDGGREGTFRDSIYGTLGSGVPAGVTATFDGHNAGVRYEADYNTYMTIVISGLKADAKYEVSIGSPATVDNFAADANGVLTLRYLLNGNDMRNGYVTINHVKSTDGAVDPKPPVDPEAKDATVTVTKGLVNIKKDGKVISKITADFKMDTANMGVKTGDVLTIEPAEALDVKGAKDNGDGTFTVEETTVTISPKAGYIWHPLFRQYVDGDGNPTLVEWVSALAVN
uniref:hypothetical protein n=1 Tax=uncultured Adlercreutzia sp. TaxID=875803 RepID=UPI00272EC209